MARAVVRLDYDPTDTLSRKRPSKWFNEQVAEDGYVFDSKAEHRRYRDLKLLQAAGEVSDLTVHPRFNLTVNGRYVGRYHADFSYQDTAGMRHVEDVKGSGAPLTPVFSLKRRLMAAIWGIDVEIIRS